MGGSGAAAGGALEGRAHGGGRRACVGCAGDAHGDGFGWAHGGRVGGAPRARGRARGRVAGHGRVRGRGGGATSSSAAICRRGAFAGRCALVAERDARRKRGACLTKSSRTWSPGIGR